MFLACFQTFLNYVWKALDSLRVGDDTLDDDALPSECPQIGLKSALSSNVMCRGWMVVWSWTTILPVWAGAYTIESHVHCMKMHDM